MKDGRLWIASMPRLAIAQALPTSSRQRAKLLATLFCALLLATGVPNVALAASTSPVPPTEADCARADFRQVFLAGDDRIHGREPWVTDGTRDGTVLLLDIHPGPTGSKPIGETALDGIVYFTANDGEHGRGLWRTDGTAVELSDWAPRIAEAAARADEVHVLMNNCYANYGAVNARQMAKLLEDLRVSG